LTLPFFCRTNLAPLKSLKLLQSINLKCNKLGRIMGPGDSAMNGSLGPLLGLRYLSDVCLEGNMPLCADSMWLFQVFQVLGRPLEDGQPGLIVDGIPQCEMEPTDKEEEAVDSASAEDAVEQMLVPHDAPQCEQRLARWRAEVQKNINLRVHFERNLAQEMAEHARFLQQYRLRQGEYERSIVDLSEQVKRSEARCAGLEGSMRSMVRTVHEGITKTTDCVMYQVQYTKLVNVLDSMLGRVSDAEARVSVATTLVNEKMHQLRNENALLEANKRFFEMEKQQFADVSAGRNDDADDDSRKLSSLLIPAVVESLFKALYKKLCCYQCDNRHSDAMHFGLVHCSDLYTILQHTPTIRSLMVSNLGSQRYRACLAQLAAIARCHDIEVDCGEGDACADATRADADMDVGFGENGYLTYGEMLLLLIPDGPRRTGASGFSHSGMHACVVCFAMSCVDSFTLCSCCRNGCRLEGTSAEEAVQRRSLQHGTSADR
jgi:hypothetical protein